jgi:hypothetical protein
MNLTQAINVVHSILGPRATIYEDRGAPDKDTRLAQLNRNRELRDTLRAARAAMEARAAELLNADPEYVRLRAEVLSAKDELSHAPSGLRYRYTVGSDQCGIRMVETQADTLGEAVHELRTRKAGALP